MSSKSASIGLLPRRHTLSDGTECAVPIRYFDNQCLVATLPTELGRAGQLLEGRACRPFRGTTGAAILRTGPLTMTTSNRRPAA